MKAVVFADANFGPAAVQKAVEYLTTEKDIDVVAVALIGPAQPGFSVSVPVIFGTDTNDLLNLVTAEYRPAILFDVTEAETSKKLARAITAARLGVETRGADYVITPPRLKTLSGAAMINIVGAGKVGKTAVALTLIKTAGAFGKPGFINMQLNAPAYPETVTDLPLSADKILGAYADGRLIASDHYTVAAASGVPTCGCGFAGTGLSGVPVSSSVADGVLLLEEAGVELVFVEGSGSSISPIKPDGWVAVVGQGANSEELSDYADAFSLSSADMVVVTDANFGKAKKGLKVLTAAVRDFNPRAPIEPGVITPCFSREVGGTKAVLVIGGAGEDISRRARVVEEKSGTTLVDEVNASTTEPEDVSLGADTVLLELGLPHVGRWVKKCIEKGLEPVFFTDYFVPAKSASFKSNAAKIIETALTAGNARR